MAEAPRGPQARDADPTRRDAPRADAAATNSPGSEAMQSRTMHDQGRYRDKIPVDDPATSPLGTDSEASGVRAPEGSMEPASPAGGAAPREEHPPGHARGETPRGATPWLWTIGTAVVIVALALAVATLF